MSQAFVPRDPKQPGTGLIPRETWDRAPNNRWTFQNIRQILPTAEVRRDAVSMSALPEAKRDLLNIRFSGPKGDMTVGQFLETEYTDGFLVLHKGQIVAEHYLNGMTPRTQHLSQSVAKSVTACVAGILIDRGLMDVHATVTTYLPELEHTAYRGATLQHILDMTSGVLFDETYTASDSHMAKLDVACGWKDSTDPSWPKAVWELILTLTELERPHGAAFNYRSIETDVLAFAMQRVSGKTLANLVSHELWMPLGAGDDAYFTVDAAGYALADGGFNATLSDFGRFGQMVANNGFFNGRQIVPATWIAETLKGNSSLFGEINRLSLPHGAYHNQFWIADPAKRILMARGVFGQLIYIDQDAELVVVKLSSWPEFLDLNRTLTVIAAIDAIKHAL